MVGLTGGIGSGKSAATKRFEEYGIEIVDADQIARDVVQPGEPALEAIAEHFGRKILNSDGTLNRQVLRERIFEQPVDKEWLEELLHPLIRERIDQRVHAATSPYVILVSPLLVESGQYKTVDRVIVVDAPESLQIERVRARDNSSDELIQAIIANQATRKERIDVANYVFTNDADLTTLHKQVDAAHQLLLYRCRQLH